MLIPLIDPTILEGCAPVWVKGIGSHAVLTGGGSRHGGIDGTPGHSAEETQAQEGEEQLLRNLSRKNFVPIRG
jgi:hypothetical protein